MTAPLDKTRAIVALAELLWDACTVGRPAPIVRRISNFMIAPPRPGDLVLETSTMFRGFDPSRVGIVSAVSGVGYDQCVTVEVLDPPCGNLDGCTDPRCIHRHNWTNARFIRLPVSPADRSALTHLAASQGGADRNTVVALLADSGITIKDPK